MNQDNRDELAHVLNRELRSYLNQATSLSNAIVDRDIWRAEALEMSARHADASVAAALSQHQVDQARRLNIVYQRENNALFMFIRMLFRRYPVLQERHEEYLAQLLAAAEPALEANEVIDLTDE